MKESDCFFVKLWQRLHLNYSDADLIKYPLRAIYGPQSESAFLINRVGYMFEETGTSALWETGMLPGNVGVRRPPILFCVYNIRTADT
jgi:hypothetical protein